MEKFLVYANETKDPNGFVTERVKRCLEVHRKTVYVKSDNPNMEEIDCVIVLGGDGTLIQAARRVFRYGIPLLGVNLGTLGYLTEVEKDNVEKAIEQVLRGDFTIESRMMLYGSTPNMKEVSLNEVVLMRENAQKIVEFNVYVDGVFLTSYKADGLIISTPTGSTAYSLSAGGPIVQPTASMIVMTPICPHSMNARSLCFSEDADIRVEIGKRRPDEDDIAEVIFDGAEISEVKSGEWVHITTARETTQFIKLSKLSFLQIMREKMKGN